MLLVAVPAINRSALSWFEWNLGLGSAVGAFYFMHLAGSFRSRSAPIATTASRFSAIHYYYLFLFLSRTTLVAQVDNCYVSRDIKKGVFGIMLSKKYVWDTMLAHISIYKKGEKEEV